MSANSKYLAVFAGFLSVVLAIGIATTVYAMTMMPGNQMSGSSSMPSSSSNMTSGNNATANMTGSENSTK